MSFVIHQVRASYAFVERNFYLIKRYWTWEIVFLLYSIAHSLSVSFIGLGMEKLNPNADIDVERMVLYLVVGTLVWRYLSMIFYWITDLISIERWEGTIEYTLMAPISRLTHMAGQTVFAVLYSIFFSGIILCVTILMFELDMSRANFLGAAVVMLAGSFSFVGIGIMGAVLPMLFPERGSQMTHIIVATLLLVSGVYYPIEVLPSYLQALGTLSPATYVLQGAREALMEGAPLASLWQYIWPLLISGVIAIPAGLWVFDQAEKYAKRAGKLARGG
ncbi:MAG: ABC transporter permease [Planctomycetales bacterium]